jgi:hypothetical protein
VSIERWATGWTAWVLIPGRGKIFSLSTASRPALEPNRSPILWVPRTISPGVKRQGREADHSPLSGVEVKNGGAIPLLPCKFSWHSA